MNPSTSVTFIPKAIQVAPFQPFPDESDKVRVHSASAAVATVPLKGAPPEMNEPSEQLRTQLTSFGFSPFVTVIIPAEAAAGSSNKAHREKLDGRERRVKRTFIFTGIFLNGSRAPPLFCTQTQCTQEDLG